MVEKWLFNDLLIVVIDEFLKWIEMSLEIVLIIF